MADLAERDGPARLAEAAGAVDVLVANAALPASGRLEDFDPDEIDRSIDVNLRAPIQLTRALLPGMLERGRGHVVLVSSLSGKVASPRSGLYSATKFGLRGFAAGLREDVEPLGIGVTVVFPGFVSDAGFFAESGVKLPRWVGTRTPEQVADGVVRGIERERAEVDVAPLSLRSARACRSWRRSRPRASSGGSARSGSPTGLRTPSATSADGRESFRFPYADVVTMGTMKTRGSMGIRLAVLGAVAVVAVLAAVVIAGGGSKTAGTKTTSGDTSALKGIPQSGLVARLAEGAGDDRGVRRPPVPVLRGVPPERLPVDPRPLRAHREGAARAAAAALPRSRLRPARPRGRGRGGTEPHVAVRGPRLRPPGPGELGLRDERLHQQAHARRRA